MTGLLVRLVGSGAVVVLAGVFLAKAGDEIASRTRLGGLWVGALLLAGVTSLPELATDVTAVRIGAPDLAAGDLFGSSLANMLILAVFDLLAPRVRLLRVAALEHVLAGTLAIILNGLAAAFILARFHATFLGVGVDALVLLGLYVLGMRAVYLHGRVAAATRAAASPAAGEERAERARRIPPAAAARFAAAAVAILLAAPTFARAAEGIAEATGLGSTLVGTLLVGLATSLPELATTAAAVRIGASDLAVGNLFGSNGFNMALFAALDLANGPGPLLATLDPVHALTGIFAVLLLALGVGALVYRAERRFAMLEPSSVGMVVLYVLAVWLLHARATAS